jgi:hypothetical protein
MLVDAMESLICETLKMRNRLTTRWRKIGKSDYDAFYMERKTDKKNANNTFIQCDVFHNCLKIPPRSCLLKILSLLKINFFKCMNIDKINVNLVFL